VGESDPVMKNKSQDQILKDHGYFAYACGGGKYSLHAFNEDTPASHRGTFRTKREAIAFALKLPKICRII
jgi:hypothetical protein